MKKIEKKYLIGGGIVVVALVLVANFALKQKTVAKPAPLTKITGEIDSISNDKSLITVKADTVTYEANMAKIKTLKNSAGEKISIDTIKVGDKIELRTRTNLEGGKITAIDAYSLKDLSIQGSDASAKSDTTIDDKK